MLQWLIIMMLLQCPVNKTGKHEIDVHERCNFAGCGGWCKWCHSFKETTTDKWFKTKADALKYIELNPKRQGDGGSLN